MTVKNDAQFEQVVQWYPGHMAAAMRRIDDYMKLIDIVIEVVDARVPLSGANPYLATLAGKRPRLLVLNREDLADAAQTAHWLEHFQKNKRKAVAVNGREQSSVSKANYFLGQLAAGARGTQRIMVVGLPNSGKSSVINGLLRRAAARTEDRAGVTRQLQWFRVGPNLELMDTPGILVPKIASPEAQWKLAIVGAVPRERYDPEDISIRFHRWLSETTKGRTKVPDLETFARVRGFMRKGGEVEYHNAAQSYIKDFNEGKFGRITLEPAPHDDDKTA
ncbi:MAG TPA: ribosome biogenesis GTPase YlqF [Candidatus Baltobacteraceae bacterium]|nr:ribosome biogenesis GTPase YlqF [Candidatus Baltobacteraceae bacterium]